MKPVENVRPGGRQDTLRAEQILDRDRNTVERQTLAARQPLVGGLGHREGALRCRRDIGVERLGLGDCIVIGGGELSRREPPAGEPVARFGQVERQQRAIAHSMTSVARERIEGGTVRPSASAVLRLTTSSNFVGCWMGSSSGLAPLRILST